MGVRGDLRCGIESILGEGSGRKGRRALNDAVFRLLVVFFWGCSFRYICFVLFRFVCFFFMLFFRLRLRFPFRLRNDVTFVSFFVSCFWRASSFLFLFILGLFFSRFFVLDLVSRRRSRGVVGENVGGTWVLLTGVTMRLVRRCDAMAGEGESARLQPAQVRIKRG